jgi:hypothetical protein
MSFVAGKLLSIYKLSFVVGSQTIFFSATNFCMPLIGSFGGVGVATGVWALMLAYRLLVGSFAWSTLAFYIPGYGAALYLATRSRWMRCGVPVACFALFLLHPVGWQAALYSAYWLIPLFIGTKATRSFFMEALGATFTAHAIGSVLWLYTVPMTPVAWLALIPIVAVERVTFAAGMVVMHSSISYVTTLLSKLAFNARLQAFLTR